MNENQRAEFEDAIGKGKTYSERDHQMFLLGYQAAFASPEVKTMHRMADCMHMVRSELIELGIIDEKVPPMFVANTIFELVQELRDALIESDNQLKQFLPLIEGGIIHVDEDFHWCLTKNRVSIAAMERAMLEAAAEPK